jgi:hypothetical protein
MRSLREANGKKARIQELQEFRSCRRAETKRAGPPRNPDMRLDLNEEKVPEFAILF